MAPPPGWPCSLPAKKLYWSISVRGSRSTQDTESSTLVSAAEVTWYHISHPRFQAGQPQGFKGRLHLCWNAAATVLALELPGGRLQATAWPGDTSSRVVSIFYQAKGSASGPLHWDCRQQNATFHCASNVTPVISSVTMTPGTDTFAAAAGSRSGCQSCHGPASEHLTWAENQLEPIPQATERREGFSASPSIAPAAEVESVPLAIARRSTR